MIRTLGFTLMLMGIGFVLGGLISLGWVSHPTVGLIFTGAAIFVFALIIIIALSD